MNRREFIAESSAALAATSLSRSALRAEPSQRKLKMAIVGTGSRGSFTWGREVVTGYSDVVEIVGLCDHNGKRVEASKKLIGTSAPTFRDFDRMIKETRPDAVIVTTVDSAHARYIIRAMELGCDVISEKPLCTDEDAGPGDSRSSEEDRKEDYCHFQRAPRTERQESERASFKEGHRGSCFG